MGRAVANMKRNAGAGRENFTRAAPKRLLKTAEAAVYLSCSTWKIRKLVMDGKLQYVADSDDTDWRFDIFDLDAFIDFNKRREETIG
jgi:excisionase family DNA binding protein